jgi:hypothetical protein
MIYYTPNMRKLLFYHFKHSIIAGPVEAHSFIMMLGRPRRGFLTATRCKRWRLAAFPLEIEATRGAALQVADGGAEAAIGR